MKKLYGFSLFLLYNSLSDEVLLKAIKFLQYEQVNAGTFIFHQGDQSNKFYGIIKGKISIRAKKARNLLNTNRSYAIINNGKIYGEETLTEEEKEIFSKSLDISDKIIRANYNYDGK